MTLENVELTVKRHNKTFVRIGLWSLIPLDWGMKFFKRQDETSQAVRFFQYKTGKSIFSPENWRRYRSDYCNYSFE